MVENQNKTVSYNDFCTIMKDIYAKLDDCATSRVVSELIAVVSELKSKLTDLESKLTNKTAGE